METQTKTFPEMKIKGSDVQKIIPFLWFDHQAEEASQFYTSIFKNSKIHTKTRYSAEASKYAKRPQGSTMTVAFHIEGQEFIALNGGPVFEITPSISFFVHYDNIQEIENLWKKLSDGGKVMMELDKYPFSEKYGWVQDKFGVSWQLILSKHKQRIVPCLMFTGDQHKKAEEAIHFYISVFKSSNIVQLEHYQESQGTVDSVVHSKFILDGYELSAMDSHLPSSYSFNPAISLVVNCETQAEIDHFWEKLSEGGDESAQQCGWLQDKYGVSWQIIPIGWEEMLRDADPDQLERIMHAMMQMKKFDLYVLEKAYG